MRRFLLAAYRLLLRLYPKGFRDRYQSEMLWTLERWLLDSPGLWSQLRVARVVLIDWGRSVARERLRERGALFPAAQQRSKRQLLERTHRPTTTRFSEGTMFSTLLFDLRFATRWLLRQPTMTAAALLTMALGIGANTAIFSVVRAVVLKPLPYEQPDEIVRIWPGATFSKEMFERFRGDAQSYSELVAVSGWAITLTGDGTPEELDGRVVTANYFRLFGGQQILGRSFLPEDGVTTSEGVAIISRALWQRRFGGDSEILGRRIQLSDGQRDSRTIVGVVEMPGELDAGIDAWLPLVIDPADRDDYTGSWYLRAYGRLAPGTPADAASAELASIARNYQRTDFTHLADTDVSTASVVVLLDELVGGVRTGLWLLLGGVALVLLMACANVANLLLARTARRQREMVVRSALGAATGRVLRQLLTESVLLGGVGGLVGAVAASVSIRVIAARLPANLPRREEVSLDLGVLGFSFAVTILASMLFGLAPALRVLGQRRHLLVARGSLGVARHGLSRTVVVGEVALAVVLVAGAGHLLMSHFNLRSVDPGFSAQHVAALRVSPPSGSYPDGPSQQQYFREIGERISSLPGVSEVGAIHLLPLTDSNWSFPYETPDHPIPANTPPPVANYRVVLGDYFQALQIPLLDGRVFTPEDRDDSQKVVVVNETMARDLWPDGDAIGREIRLFRSESLAYRVIGVVGDVHQHRLQLVPQPEMYYSHLQRPAATMHLMARMSGEPSQALAMLRDAVWSVDEDVPIGIAAPMAQIVEQSVASSRFFASLLALFAAIALLLGSVGVYGVMSYTMAERDREFGVRIALGARAGQILLGALGSGVGLVSLGVVVGLAGSLVSGRLLSSLLFEVDANDPTILAAVAVVLIATALIACYLPARRASSVDPIVVLRSDD